MKGKILTSLLVLFNFLIGCNNPKETDTFRKGQVIEYAPIVLKDSVTEEALLMSSEVLQRDFLTNQQGFIKRVLVRKSAREFVDIVVWDSRESANKALEHSMQSKACESYFNCMKNLDPGNVLHFEVLAEYTN